MARCFSREGMTVVAADIDVAALEELTRVALSRPGGPHRRFGSLLGGGVGGLVGLRRLDLDTDGLPLLGDRLHQLVRQPAGSLVYQAGAAVAFE